MEDKCVFGTVAQGTPQMLFGVLSIRPCATTVNDFLGVVCAIVGVSCYDQILRPCTYEFLFVSSLSSI